MNINTKKIKKGFQVLMKAGPKQLVQKVKDSKNPVWPLSPLEQLSKVTFTTGVVDIVLEKGVSVTECSRYLKSFSLNYRLFVFEETNEIDVDVINEYTFQNVFSIRAFFYIYQQNPCDFEKCFNIKFDKNSGKEMNEYVNTLSGMKLLANYNAQNNISVKTSTFFHYEGTDYCSGGAERYLLDLHEICQSMNLNLNVYQIGSKPFFRKYQNMNVIGLSLNNEPITTNYDYIDKQTKNYIYHTYHNTSLHIYSAFQECYPNHIGPSIGISHGISWDNRMNHYEYGRDYFWEKKKRYLDGAFFCDRLISVDTNTANWFQTIDYELGNQKCHVIPNYVDATEFTPRQDFLNPQERIVIVYPRRLCEPRGLYITLEVIDDILKKYDKVEFHFVGKGTEEDVQMIMDKIKKYPDQIKCYNKAPQEMKEVYQHADISLIPTQYSEGTSLSCLEAMASGNLVIATRIGGLTDLIINQFNGYLIEPDSKALKDCLIQILDHFSEQKEIRKRAVESSKSFSKLVWQKRWKQELSRFDLSKKSKNNDLVEIHLNDVTSVSDRILKIIKQELLQGNLIYLRVKEFPEKDIISHGLLQVVDEQEEVVSEAIRSYDEIKK